MAETATEALIGGVVIAAAAGFLLYAGQTTGVSGGDGSYDLRASFRSVDGISVGSEVRLAGVKVGTVTDLSLNPQTFRADTTVAIDSTLSIPEDSAILISQQGLLGGNYVEIVPGGSPFNLEPGGEIVDTQGSVSLLSLLARFVSESGSE
ncbi:MAG: outer membrane lipid asymmetry maintenance protein MlaD [Rhodobacteraceae bacterium]|jgi:phospholipid/cholesterol/gamma-HCH transport system substrate-binding protein|nr:outer membrane lipid asymmetry maintenance protein MlaD [Paracoccaceae bacterium]MBL4557515.1 outer membrane lipid asymmetry maintenance protein MlaD [Paracoccaceae bacterium]HBG99430.1 outer membrane lipid asymmetry maintenance protein MlaD [Paracoccaceae bacterium]